MSTFTRRAGTWAAVLIVGMALAAVFLAWQSPHLIVDLSAYVAACF